MCLSVSLLKLLNTETSEKVYVSMSDYALILILRITDKLNHIEKSKIKRGLRLLEVGESNQISI